MTKYGGITQKIIVSTINRTKSVWRMSNGLDACTTIHNQFHPL